MLLNTRRSWLTKRHVLDGGACCLPVYQISVHEGVLKKWCYRVHVILAHLTWGKNMLELSIAGLQDRTKGNFIISINQFKPTKSTKKREKRKKGQIVKDRHVPIYSKRKLRLLRTPFCTLSSGTRYSFMRAGRTVKGEQVSATIAIATVVHTRFCRSCTLRLLRRTANTSWGPVGERNG